ncbi:MAG: hypothetical protein HXY45_09435 [Syntrophaceae bacterium]|jgi:polyhydroxyalkanoate synthesis regulator phasin|nr:hypothetical protein [Syntrophaceae bacterium]
MGLLKKGILFGIGLVSHAEEKLESFSEEMVKKGEVAQQEVKKKMEERLAASRKKKEGAEKTEPARMKEQMVEAGLVSREDLQKLEDRIAALESKLDRISRA